MQAQGEEMLLDESAELINWFARLEFFLTLVRRSWYATTKGMKALYEITDTEVPLGRKSILGHFTFPELTNHDRYLLLKAASYFQLLSPDSLIKELLAAGLTQAQMVPAGIYCPESLKAIKQTLPCTPSKKRSTSSHGECWPQPRSQAAVQRLLNDLYREKRRRER
jgi:hypothetical protein